VCALAQLHQEARRTNLRYRPQCCSTLQACSSDVGLNGARCFWQVYRYPGVYGDAYPRLHAHSLGLRADRVNGPYDDQTGAFPPVEPHRADVIPEARADLRSELPAACGGLSALQRPRPHVLVPAARAWVTNQVQNGRSAVNAQHAARESPPRPGPMAPPDGTNELGIHTRVGVPPGR